LDRSPAKRVKSPRRQFGQIYRWEFGPQQLDETALTAHNWNCPDTGQSGNAMFTNGVVYYTKAEDYFVKIRAFCSRRHIGVGRKKI